MNKRERTYDIISKIASLKHNHYFNISLSIFGDTLINSSLLENIENNKNQFISIFENLDQKKENCAVEYINSIFNKYEQIKIIIYNLQNISNLTEVQNDCLNYFFNLYHTTKEQVDKNWLLQKDNLMYDKIIQDLPSWILKNTSNLY